MSRLPSLRSSDGAWGVRPFDMRDVAALARAANDPRVRATLRDSFPFPYEESNAKEWIVFTGSQEPRCNFAITVAGEVAGGIGAMLKDDIYRRGAEFGYWLGPAYWNKGIATWAAGAFAEWAFDAYDLIRVEAHVYSHNPASARVLEKCGFEREGTMRQAVVKDGHVRDAWLYARVRAVE